LTELVELAELRLSLVEFERNPPEKGDYLHIHAAACSRGYQGWCRFWVASDEMQAFLGRLEAFDRTLSGTPSLRCGWDGDISFELTLLAYDRLGHLGVQLTVAVEPTGRASTRQRLSVEFEIEPNQLQRFIAGLKRLASGAAEEIVLRSSDQ